ncbi:MAG: hypothetical protein AAGD14_01100 [Planctomycetota bacterium]
MKSSRRDELREPVHAFAARLASGEPTIPLQDLAAMFGAQGAVLAQVAKRGDIRLNEGKFVNDGPDLVLQAGSVELEIPNLMRGTYTSDGPAFSLRFPNPEFSLRACAKIAVLRKCFDLFEVRADAGFIELDFGNGLADRRYEFDS